MMREINSKISGFYKLEVKERQNTIIQLFGLDKEEMMSAGKLIKANFMGLFCSRN